MTIFIIRGDRFEIAAPGQGVAASQGKTHKKFERNWKFPALLSESPAKGRKPFTSNSASQQWISLCKRGGFKLIEVAASFIVTRGNTYTVTMSISISASLISSRGRPEVQGSRVQASFVIYIMPRLLLKRPLCFLPPRFHSFCVTSRRRLLDAS